MKKRRIFLSFIVSYFIIFLIPILVNTVSQAKLMANIERYLCESKLESLNQSKAILDDNFSEIDSIISDLSLELKIKILSYKVTPTMDSSVIPAINRAHELLSYSIYPRLVDDFFIYIKKPDIYISPHHVFLSSRDFYNMFFTYDNLDSIQWKELFEERGVRKRLILPSAPAKIGTAAHEYLLYIHSYSVGPTTPGVFFVPIRTDYIKNLLPEGMPESNNFSFISDDTGTLLLSTVSDDAVLKEANRIVFQSEDGYHTAKVGNESFLIMRTTSSYNGFIYASILPHSYVLGHMSSLRLQLFYFMMIAIVVGGLIIVVFAYRKSKPITEMIALVNNHFVEQDGPVNLSNMVSSVSTLIDSNRELSQYADTQKPMIRLLMQDALFKGTYLQDDSSDLWGSETPHDHIIRTLGICFEGQLFCVTIASIEINDLMIDCNIMQNADEYALLKQLVLIEAMKALSIPDCIYDINFHQFAFIIYLPSRACNAHEYTLEYLSTIVDTIADKYGFSAFFYCGEVYTNYMDVSKSFDEAMEALNYRSGSDIAVTFNSCDHNESDHYYFPLGSEERLINAIKLGDEAMTEEQLRKLYHENIVKRNLSPAMLRFLIWDLQCTLLKTYHQLSNDDTNDSFLREIEAFSEKGDFIFALQKLINCSQKLCRIAQEKKEQKVSAITSQILHYVEERYAEPDMGLPKAAEHFGFSPAYFSVLFKSHCGENFSSILEKTRIRKAMELLEQDEKLEAIASLVGYSSVYVLRNAFKRINGMTPNEYRIRIKDCNT